MPIDTSDRWTPLPPDSMKLITALQVLCMMLSEPAATACMPGDTPIDTVSISTPLAAKKPFLAATTPGQTVAVGETWPKETLVAEQRGRRAERKRLQRQNRRPYEPHSEMHPHRLLGAANSASAGFISPPVIVSRRPIGAVRCALVAVESM